MKFNQKIQEIYEPIMDEMDAVDEVITKTLLYENDEIIQKINII